MARYQVGVTDHAADAAGELLGRGDRERCDRMADAVRGFVRSLLAEDGLDGDGVGEVVRATAQAFRLAYATIRGVGNGPAGGGRRIGMNPWVPHVEDI